MHGCVWSLCNVLDRTAKFTPSDVQFKDLLQIHPEVGLHAEIAARAQGGVSADRPLAGNDLRDAVRRHAYRGGQFRRGNLISSN